MNEVFISTLIPFLILIPCTKTLCVKLIPKITQQWISQELRREEELKNNLFLLKINNHIIAINDDSPLFVIFTFNLRGLVYVHCLCFWLPHIATDVIFHWNYLDGSLPCSIMISLDETNSLLYFVRFFVTNSSNTYCVFYMNLNALIDDIDIGFFGFKLFVKASGHFIPLIVSSKLLFIHDMGLV